MRKKVFKFLFLGIFSCSFASFGEENILSLLKKYEEASQLYKKTKRESLGHIIVFTRKDLEEMQAYTLSDVLKLIPLNHYFPNNFGVQTLTGPGRPPTIPFVYRLYIDDHEVSSIHTYNPFLNYDKYPLDHINHIEIYFSAGAISVSTEQSQMIVKLYTKVPERENISKVRLSVGTEKSYDGNFFSATKFSDNSSLLLTFSKTFFNLPSLSIHNQRTDRDYYRKHLFLKYEHKKTYFTFSAVDLKREGFAGFSFDKAPEVSDIQSLDTYLSIKHNFDKKTKVIFSYDYQKRKYKERNPKEDGGIVLPGFYNPLNPITYYREDINFHKIAISYDKKISTVKNSFLIGTFFRYYVQDIHSLRASDSIATYNIKDKMYRVKNFYIASFYLENSFNIDENKLLIGGVKIDKYKYYWKKSKEKINLRLGAISFPTSDLMFKSFVSRYYIIPSVAMLESAKDNNLDPVESTGITAELKYSKNKNKIRFFFSHYKIKNLIVLNPITGLYKSIKRSNNVNKYALFVKRDLNRFTSLELNYWITDVGKNKLSPDRGGYLRISHNIKQFSLYTDLVYKGSYNPFGIHLDKSLDLKIAVGYKNRKGWSFKLSGENLLNSSQRTVYLNNFKEKAPYFINYRRVLLTVEKIF